MPVFWMLRILRANFQRGVVEEVIVFTRLTHRSYILSVNKEPGKFIAFLATVLRRLSALAVLR